MSSMTSTYPQVPGTTRSSRWILVVIGVFVLAAAVYLLSQSPTDLVARVALPQITSPDQRLPQAQWEAELGAGYSVTGGPWNGKGCKFELHKGQRNIGPFTADFCETAEQLRRRAEELRAGYSGLEEESAFESFINRLGPPPPMIQ